jgi:DNA-binding protein H-NS
MALKTMPIDKLRDLHSKVEAAIHSKVTERRRELEAELAQLARYDGARTKVGRGGARGSVAAKYRNPENPSETWAGRGLAPRWMTAAIKAGKTKEDFLIEGASSKSSSAKQTTKTRKMRKSKK